MNVRALVVVLAALSACAPKEARDPSEILAEDPTFQRSLQEAEGPPEAGGAAPAGRAARVATRGECEAAARHLAGLELTRAMQRAASDEERLELEEQRAELLKSPALRAQMEQNVEECLARETPAREARCVAKVQSEDDLEACAR